MFAYDAHNCTYLRAGFLRVHCIASELKMTNRPSSGHSICAEHPDPELYNAFA